MITQSTEKERIETEMFRNIERMAAWQLRKEGYVQPVVWRAK